VKKIILLPFLLIFSLLLPSSCDENDVTPDLDVPDTYDFQRDGASTVFYGGQSDRLNQLTEIKNYLRTGDNGALLDAQKLNDMFANTNGDGNGNFSFTSSRQLKDKTFIADLTFFENLFEGAEAASAAGNSGTTASDGEAGLLTRSNGNTILVDGNGKEFTQVFEKGIMGSTFLNQIFNVYLTDARVGNSVNNETPVSGENYTDMEHHWDEAFGYYGVPVDFPGNIVGRLFWGNYSNTVDPSLSTNEMLMDAFKTGRAAIVAKQYDIKDQQREVLYDGFELVAAATSIHYLNLAKASFAAGTAPELADAFHELSEGTLFIRALRLSPHSKIELSEIETILGTHIGNNFWDIADTDLSGLDDAIDALVVAYPELGPVKDSL
jgi:hypothetical protein